MSSSWLGGNKISYHKQAGLPINHSDRLMGVSTSFTDLSRIWHFKLPRPVVHMNM